MAYRIEGLASEVFSPLFALGDEALERRGARRMTANGPGFPCRVSLEEAQPGETVLLINHVSLEAATPFRASHAIFVRKGARQQVHVDRLPPMFERRTLSLRGFDRHFMLQQALLAFPGDAGRCIADLFSRREITEIHAHVAAQGCFLARIVRQ